MTANAIPAGAMVLSRILHCASLLLSLKQTFEGLQKLMGVDVGVQEIVLPRVEKHDDVELSVVVEHSSLDIVVVVTGVVVRGIWVLETSVVVGLGIFVPAPYATAANSRTNV